MHHAAVWNATCIKTCTLLIPKQLPTFPNQRKYQINPLLRNSYTLQLRNLYYTG
jgi:hypothetical protein